MLKKMEDSLRKARDIRADMEPDVALGGRGMDDADSNARMVKNQALFTAAVGTAEQMWAQIVAAAGEDLRAYDALANPVMAAVATPADMKVQLATTMAPTRRFDRWAMTLLLVDRRRW